MKRKPFIFAITLLFIVGAALWGVNYRLNNPPLTQADKEFRALVAGADSVQIYRNNFRIKSSLQPTTFYSLGAPQTRQMLDKFRFSDEFVLDAPLDSYYLTFRRGSKILLSAQLSQNSPSTTLVTTSGAQKREYKLQPRFAKRLEIYLNQLPAQTPPNVKLAPSAVAKAPISSVIGGPPPPP